MSKGDSRKQVKRRSQTKKTKYQIPEIKFHFRLPGVRAFDFRDVCARCVPGEGGEGGGAKGGGRGRGTGRRREERSTRGEGGHGTAREGRAVNIE